MAARITKDELNERLDIIKKNKNIVMVGELQPDKIRTTFKCLTCEYEFKSTLWMMYKGPQGCGRCSGKVLTTQDITDRLRALHDRGILFDDVYTKIKAKYNFRCLKCDYTWNTTLTHIHHSDTGCGRCSKVRLTEQDIQDKILEIKSRGIELISPYTKIKDKHTFYCNLHEVTWVTDFGNISRGKGCRKCRGSKISKRLSTPIKDVETKILELNSRGIYLASDYTKMSNRHEFLCNKHEPVFKFSIPFDGIKGCPKCVGRHKTEKESENLKALTIIRGHLHAQMHRGKISSRTSKLEIVEKIKEYWYKQWSLIPTKPGKGYSLDHIIPISKFNPNDIESMKLCWDYRNFQWLTHDVNSSKSNRIMPEYFTEWHYETCKKLGIQV